MIGRLNHVAIVVPDLTAAAQMYKQTLGATVTDQVPLPDHGVTTVFVELPNTKIELLPEDILLEMAPTLIVVCGFITSYSLWDVLAVGVAKEAENYHQIKNYKT